jgi:hypothetical protein
MIFRLNFGAVLEMWYFLVFFILFYQFVLSTTGVSLFLEFKFSWIYNIQRNVKKNLYYYYFVTSMKHDIITAPKFNRKIIERESNSIPKARFPVMSYSLPIKVAGVQTSSLNKMMRRLYKFFFLNAYFCFYSAVLEMWYFLVFFILFYQFVLSTMGV